MTGRHLEPVHIIGGGPAGSEAAWQLATRGVAVVLHEMRPTRPTAAHKSTALAELVWQCLIGARRRGVIYLIDIYAKSEKEDVTDAQRREIRKLVVALEAEG